MREIIAGTEGWGGGRGRRRRHQARLLLLIIMVLQYSEQRWKAFNILIYVFLLVQAELAKWLDLMNEFDREFTMAR